MADTGGLEISLASNLILEIMAPAQQVLEEEQLPFLKPAASRLAIASNPKFIASTTSSARSLQASFSGQDQKSISSMSQKSLGAQPTRH